MERAGNSNYTLKQALSKKVGHFGWEKLGLKSGTWL